MDRYSYKNPQITELTWLNKIFRVKLAISELAKILPPAAQAPNEALRHIPGATLMKSPEKNNWEEGWMRNNLKNKL